MRRNLEERDIEWRVVHGVLERTVTLASGKSYRHRCTRKTFEQLIEYIDDHIDAPITMNSIVEATDAPFTQANVALELLKERCIIETNGRKSYVGPGYRDGFYDHAMTEYCALEAGMPPEHRPAGDSGREDEPNQ
jgi:hypothetical protein